RRRDADGHDRGTSGWDYVHVAVDDYSRLAYAEVLPDERATTAIAFLKRALAFYACRQLGIRHLRTRPRRPQTNGKAERFIRTLLNGWAYGAIYRSSTERTKALDGWLWHYNHRRQHAALGHQAPITRTNVLGSYI